MLSRVATSHYWLARYLERADHAARLLTVTHAYAQELRGVSPAAAERCWEVACRLLGTELRTAENSPALFQRLVLDYSASAGVLTCLHAARENARSIRDALSSEMWETVNVLYLRVLEESTAPPSEASELSLLRRVQTAAHLFQGLRDNTLSRTDGWLFLLMGQFLERAGCVAGLLDSMYSHPALVVAEGAGHAIDPLHLATTLRCAAALEAFAIAEGILSPERVAAFLLLDHTFPRSVEHAVQEVARCLHTLSGSSFEIFSNDAEQICGRLVSQLRFATIEEIFQGGLSPYVQELIRQTYRLGQAIELEYFG